MYLKVVAKDRWTILAACTARGDCPLLDFLEDLPANLRKDGRKLEALLGRVKQLGPSENTEKSHQISGQIWEFIAGRLRILWFYDGGKLIVASHGFVKKDQKTPSAEISRAKAIYKSYQLASKAGELEIERL